MAEPDVEERFLRFAAALMRLPREAISPATAWGSLPEWDSVMHLRLVMETEAEFGVRFSLEEIPELSTLRAFIARIAERRNA